MHVPSATYRLQFTKEFGFQDARAIVPFLHRLGISDLYASPIFQARSGSEHGYDVTNPSRLNPELGTREEFDALTEELRRHGMNLLLDIVPNHMAVSGENEWWTDVLENGAGSAYSGFFGVDWGALNATPEDDKIYLPVLGDPFGRALEWGHLQLGLDAKGLFVSYYSHHLPLDPGTYGTVLAGPDAPALGEEDAADWQRLLESIHLLPRRVATTWELTNLRASGKEEIKQKLWDLYTRLPAVREYIDARIQLFNGSPADPHSYDALERLLDEQPYRIAYWRTAREKINYRRFFDVTDLISIRAELPKVFEATHQLSRELYEAGQVSGFRVDHVDGLVDPREYLCRLRTAMPDAYLVVEKITLGAEELPVEWPVQGTTGYDFLAALEGVCTFAPGLEQLDGFYREFTGRAEDFATLCYRNKKRIMDDLFKGEVLHLGDALIALSEWDRHARDLSPDALRCALVEVTACLPVYRTYSERAAIRPHDKLVVEAAVAEAHARDAHADAAVYTFLRRVLTADYPMDLTEDQRKSWLRFVRRWQQLTGPIMAKGVEDTTFYQYNRLISLNEVGGDLQTLTLGEFHARQQRQREHWPHTLLASATHDSKRGEDVRARLNVLTEMAPEWAKLVQRWSRFNQKKKADHLPEANEEYFLYQILIGAWPLWENDIPAFLGRLKAYLVKASREAKAHSSWLRPDESYEKRFQEFAAAILDPAPDNRFYQQFREFQQKIAFYGAMTSLSQVLLKATCPGVPDFYQGAGLWDLSLVDPDNRRPVDYALRERMLANLPERSLAELLRCWPDGGVKLFLTQRLLEFRRLHAELFAHGSYEPLPVAGEQSGNLIAFTRRHGNEWIVVAAPRYYSQLSVLQTAPLGRRIWRDTRVTLPSGAPSSWQNVLTGSTLATGNELPVAEALREFPVALLTSNSGNPYNQD